MKWFVGNGSTTCPLCRHVVDDDDIRLLLEDRPFTRGMQTRVDRDFQTWRCRRLLNMVRDRVLPMDILFMARSVLFAIFDEYPDVYIILSPEYVRTFYHFF